MALYKIGEVDGAPDEANASNIRNPASDSYAAVQEVVAPIAAAVVASDPTVAAAAAAAASTAVDGAIADRNLVESDVTTTTDDAVVGLVDQDGIRLPGAQWDTYGRPANAMMRTLMNRGMIRGDEGSTGTQVFKDALGARTWLSIAPDGGFDHATYTYLVNRLHWAASDDPPFVYPGNYIIWLNTTDLSLHRLEN